MKCPARDPSSEIVLRDLWLGRGCPERMTVRVLRTGETLTLSKGSPVTDPAEKYPLFTQGSEEKKPPARVRWPVTDNRHCEACQGEFPSRRKDARYCSSRCRKKAARQQAEQLRRLETERMLSACGLGRGAGL